MRRLAAHHLAADDTFGVLHRDAALCLFHVDDEGDDGEHTADQDEQSKGSKGAPCSVYGLLPEIADAGGKSDDNTRKDEQAHSVADAAFRDLLAQPHHEAGTGGPG